MLSSGCCDEHVVASIVREIEATKECDKISPHFIEIRRRIKIERWEKILECKDDEQDIKIACRVLDKTRMIREAYNGLKLKTKISRDFPNF